MDFVVLDTDLVAKGTNCVPIILERPFLATSNAIIDCRNGVMELTIACYSAPLEEEGRNSIFIQWGRDTEAVKEEPPKLILKPLPMELKYAYLEENKQSPVVISSFLTTTKEDCLLEVLKRCKKVIGWKIYDLKRINPLVCTHHIYMEEEAKPAGIIYPISDSPWVSPTQVVPKKSGIMVDSFPIGVSTDSCPLNGP
ncbi:hypothetical protein CK203_114874 [Vitis vinifera]|uniref:Uncharacterized protein n=1 Tax=Vitis vinifera TaxID=29760 RepID=A0A438CUB0_VITVI|nr:hypothetical protein CK203_114874 [Vitis vinifera]